LKFLDYIYTASNKNFTRLLCNKRYIFNWYLSHYELCNYSNFTIYL